MENKKYSRVYVEITNICNKNCSFCPGTKREKRRMSLEEFKKIAHNLVGVTEYLYLHLMGEPLTHPDLAEIIKYANSLGFKCAITTNGSLISSRRDSLIASGVYKVNMSVHSFEEGSDEEHIAYLDSLCDFADKASRAGVLCVFRFWNKGCDDERNEKALAHIKSRLDGEWKWSDRGARIRHRLHLEYADRFAWPDMQSEDKTSSLFCYGLRDHFGVLSDGSVVPCCLDHDGDITLGNALTTPVREILSSKRATDILRGFDRRCAVEELCQKCGYARRFG